MMPKPKVFPAQWSQTALPEAVAKITNALGLTGNVQRLHCFLGQQTAYLLLCGTTAGKQTSQLISLGAASAARPLTYRTVSPADVEQILSGNGRENIRQLDLDALRSALEAVSTGGAESSVKFLLSSDGRVQVGDKIVELVPAAAES